MAKELILVDKEELKQIFLEALADNEQKKATPSSKEATSFIDSFEVAKMTSSHITTVRRWAKEGSIIGFKLDRKILFDRNQVNEFVRKKQIQPRKFSES